MAGEKSVQEVADAVWDEIKAAYHWEDGFTSAFNNLRETVEHERDSIPQAAQEEISNRGYAIRFLLREMVRLGVPMDEGYTFHNGDTYFPLGEDE